MPRGGGGAAGGNGTPGGPASHDLDVALYDQSRQTRAQVDTTASGDQVLVVGADGYDDLSANVAGQRNILTYDDSNVVVGGSGDVNAQIGDSDTSGAVVMGVEDSLIESGPST